MNCVIHMLTNATLQYTGSPFAKVIISDYQLLLNLHSGKININAIR